MHVIPVLLERLQVRRWAIVCTGDDRQYLLSAAVVFVSLSLAACHCYDGTLCMIREPYPYSHIRALDKRLAAAAAVAGTLLLLLLLS